MSSSLAPALGTLQRSDGPKPLFLFGCVLCNGRYQKLAAEPKPVTVVLPFPSDHKQPRERGFPQRGESERRGQAFKASESLKLSALLARMKTVSRALSKLGNDVVARMAQEVVRGAGVVRLQFLASEFYEAVKAELDQTPRHEASRVGALVAAADQCRRSAENCTSPQLMLVEIRAAVSMLSESAGVQPGAVVRFRPQLRVIQGGLS